MLEIKDLNVKLKKETLLEDINLKLLSGELNIIIGPNGAGKSTFLKSLIKIVDIYKGEIFLDNRNLTKSSINELSKDIAYMAQFNQNSNLNTIDVLEISRRKHSGFTLKNRDHDLIEEIIKEFELQKFLHRNIDTLSGGERQKIFLAAAIIQEPKVLLLDEPISHLDPKNQIEMLEIIKRKTKENNFITITVLHDLQNALHYANKIIMLKNKRVIDFQDSINVDEKMVSKLFEIPCKLFWQEGHPFSFFGHSHDELHKNRHSHKKENNDT
ncbi:ABC transporter ATP-binding protein [Halarcobacter anaerophilus]|uniref:ABC transporter ATP-binding protein n=1 Tax=Halarcobacter anaerophilus TaxID=877500 RepID=UPI0005C8AC80|nr:ABC transporter ATP-binding protein [Halarcobacter anaerophilus]